MKKIVRPGAEIYNRDVFEVLFEYEVSRSKRYPSPLALIQVEITPSAMNEAGLHNASAIFTAKLNAVLRSVDIPCAGAQNTFNILLPTTDEAGTRAVCERILSVFKNKISAASGEVAFSLQIGANCHSGGDALSAENLVQKSIEALKQSKLKGPNTFVLIAN